MKYDPSRSSAIVRVGKRRGGQEGSPFTLFLIEKTSLFQTQREDSADKSATKKTKPVGFRIGLRRLIISDVSLMLDLSLGGRMSIKKVLSHLEDDPAPLLSEATGFSLLFPGLSAASREVDGRLTEATVDGMRGSRSIMHRMVRCAMC